MIAWRTIDDALRSAVAAASGVADVRWRWEPPTMRQAARIYLERGPVAPIGIDERRHEHDSVVDALSASQVGQRSFRLEVRCETHRGSASDLSQADAADILSALLTRIRRPSVMEVLHEAGVALSTIGPIVRQSYNDGTRDVRVAVVDLTLLCADVDFDGEDYFIETVNGDIVVERPDGSDITTPFSGTVVP